MSILSPKSVALIGASDNPAKLGHIILQSLMNGGFKGKICPINPKHKKLLGLPTFASISDIKGAVDLAVIVTPAPTVPGIAEECGKKGVKTLVVISAGFSELGTHEGRAREDELLVIAKKHGMKLIGPNCLGILCPPIGLNASFAATPKESGNVALISQSGALAVALLDQAPLLGLAFSLVVSIGNKADQTESDLLELALSDPKTRVIGLYLESIKDGKRFVDVASRTAGKKPIVLIKSGTSVRGARAVSSHTGALAGSTAALDAACRAAGIRRAENTEEFMNLLAAFSTQPPLLSRSIAVITNAGGPGVLATDAAERAGLELAALTEKTIQTLKETLPPAASSGNPIDVLGDALEDRYSTAIDAAADDPGVDGIVALLTPQVMTPTEKIARAVLRMKKTHRLIPITTAFMGGSLVGRAREILRAGGIPTFESPEDAVETLSKLRPMKPRSAPPVEERSDDRTSAASGLLKGKHGLLREELVSDLFSLYDLPLPNQAVARRPKEATDLAEEIGFPVILKVSSPDILHKTDIGGVRANLRDRKAVEYAYVEILKNVSVHAPTAAIAGILVQKFLPAGSEFIVGGLKDRDFGPLVMVGLGGIYTELFRDTCFSLAPVSLEEAFDMLSRLKAWKLLTGMRGKTPLKIDELAETVRLVSFLLSECPSVKEIDLNPVLVSEERITVADAKVVVDRGIENR